MARLAFLTAIAVALLSFCAIAQPSIKVSLEPRTFTASEGEKVEVKLVIVSGSQLAYAGEFNVSYPSSMAKVSVESGKNWTVTWKPSVQRYVFYRVPETIVSDPSTLAVLTVEVQPGATSFTINLTLFKAADASGNDLSITFENQVVNVTVMGRGGGGGGGGEEQVSGVGGGRAGGIDWRMISIAAATIAVAAVAVVAVYYVYAQPAVYLLIDGQALRLRGSRIVIGREDLAGILPPEKLAYVTRRAKGGQFQIIRYGNAFYIQDPGSTNGTYVNGVDIRGRGWVQLRSGDVISVPNAFQAMFRAG
ncbi:MAG: FHA domain-containing protein [Thermofilum sp.]|nr:FHA domain-containing protein [Thermofilum sp.]